MSHNLRMAKVLGVGRNLFDFGLYAKPFAIPNSWLVVVGDTMYFTYKNGLRRLDGPKRKPS